MRISVWVMASAALLTACAASTWPEPRAEVWLLMGQSNMSGRGRVADLPAGLARADDRIRLLGNDGIVRTATEPLDTALGQIDAVSADGAAGVGPGLAFARARLAFAPARRIVLVPCAKGGSSIAQWAPASSRETLFGSCLARARQAQGLGRLAGVLWFQGESDTRTQADADAWRGRFLTVIHSLRTELASGRMPILVVSLADPPRIGPYAGRYPAWETVRRAQDGLVTEAVLTVPARGLPKDEDDLHVSTSGQQTLGRRLARAAEMIHIDNYADRPD